MEQVFLAPGPKQSDFDALSNTVSTLNTQLANKIGYIDVPIGGTNLTLTEGNYHYTELTIGSQAPSGSTFISAVQVGNWNTDIHLEATGNVLRIVSDARTSIPANRTVRVFYYMVN